MLVFSKLFAAKSKASPGGLIVSAPLNWWVSSPLTAPIEALVKTMLSEGEIRLGNTRLFVEKLEVERTPDISERMVCETISPVVASTGIKEGGKLLKRFLSPDDSEFWRVVKDNLFRKAEALGIPITPETNLYFETVGKWRSRLFTVQKINVRGYEGRFIIEGNWLMMPG
ncbi:MAG: CRISPR-associated endoribonuclease Cas6 [Thermosediminibacteraceae bacterium]|nr:CRISPR-associated endoribonuclease Cas6 [Thermosediminibacteraceae bacterium]